MSKFIDDLELLVTDYEGTIYKGYPEIKFGYFAAQRSLDKGRVDDALRIFSGEQMKAFVQLKKEGGSPQILNYLGKTVLKGRDLQILDDFKEVTVDGFEENLSLPLRVPYMFIKNEAGSGYYDEAIDTFSKISRKHGVDTMIYSQSLKELIELNLERYGHDRWFTEGVVGNSLKIDSENKIQGIEWKVDYPGMEIDEQKLRLLDFIEDELNFYPEEVCYIDNEMVGLLEKLKERGGTPLIAPSAEPEVKDWAERNNIPSLENWNDLE